jgi:hypothetical protein
VPVFIVLYRILETNTPTIWDFTSMKGRGGSLRHNTRKAMRLFDGLSVYRNEDHARQLATASPRIGNFIAELRVPTGADVTIQFDSGLREHCTIWGDPAQLLSFVDGNPIPV